MERIMVLGCCGAGKSTFSRALQAITKLELIHLDQYYWKPDWEETAAAEWNEVVQKLAEKPAWIIDGNYGGTMDIRIQRADTIVYLDYSTWKCLWRVSKRILKYNGKVRPDMGKDCKERFNLAFIHYVATFNWVRRKKLLQKLNLIKGKKKVVIFNNDQASNDFLEQLKKQK